jgi:hypothetical protein
VEKVQELVALIFLQLSKSSDEAGVDIERLQPSDRVRSHRRVMRVDRWSVWSTSC